MHVSVAMATFDGVAYLDEQLASLARQTRPPDELVISDDGSSDGTIEVCRRFAADAPFPVLLLRQPGGLGPTRNFERALEHCGGDVVFLSDQDDVWSPMKIAAMLATFEAEPGAQLLIHDLRFCDAQLVPLPTTKLRRVRRLGGGADDYVTGMATALRRSLLSQLLPFPPSWPLAHDDWLHACACALGVKRVVPDVLAQYRRHGSNVTAASTLNAPRTNAVRERLCGMLRPVPVELLAREAQALETVRAWLAQRSSTLVDASVTSAERLERSIARHDRRIEAARRRGELLTAPLPRRARLAFGLWRSGGYANYQGLVSFVKDLALAPRS